MQLVRLAIYNGSADSEFGDAVAAVSLRMDFHDFGDVAPLNPVAKRLL